MRPAYKAAASEPCSLFSLGMLDVRALLLIDLMPVPTRSDLLAPSINPE